MRVHRKVVGGMYTTMYEFLSLGEFSKWVKEAPTSDVFKGKRLSSKDGDSYFTHTENFDEAWKLMTYGWDGAAKQMTGEYKKMRDFRQTGMALSMRPDVMGFQPIVPNWLANQPMSMINARMDVKKQKVLNMVKIITYNGGMSAKTMMEDGIKTLVMIDTLERSGYRINLEVCDMGSAGGEHLGSMVRVKNANERFNVSKIAFPIAHPSMLRRMLFRFVECCPHANRSFCGGYGKVPSNNVFLDTITGLGRNYYVIPARIGDDYTPHTLEEFKEIFNVR